MRLATYNIWNADRGMPQRMDLIIQECNTIQANILCLQEVAFAASKKIINACTHDPYHHYLAIDQEGGGLLTLSQYKIIESIEFQYALFCVMNVDGLRILVINVHLPWDSILKQEHLIIDIIKKAETITCDYAFLMGDFNASAESSVHHFITGQRSLHHQETNPYWNDLAEAYADITNSKPRNTLDLRANPRWQNKPFAVKSERVDRIYNKDAFPKPFVMIHNLELFGKKVDKETAYCASDHYGVVCDIEW